MENSNFNFTPAVVETPAVKTLVADAKSIAKQALAAISASIDSAIAAEPAAVAKLAPEVISAVESIIVAVVPSSLRGYVQAGLGILPVGSALPDLTGANAALMAVIKAHVDQLGSLIK
jgi:hypothetical protein